MEAALKPFPPPMPREEDTVTWGFWRLWWLRAAQPFSRVPRFAIHRL